jgi:hypothetical protein
LAGRRQRHCLSSPNTPPDRAVAWQSSVIIGGAPIGSNANQEFTIHVLAVTEGVSTAFERYAKDSGKRKEWHGVPKPPDSRILATLRLVRDDSVSMFDFMKGVYDEYLPNGTPTGGMIQMKTNGRHLQLFGESRCGRASFDNRTRYGRPEDRRKKR